MCNFMVLEFNNTLYVIQLSDRVYKREYKS